MLFHIALPEDWARARREGTYDMSTRGVVVTEDGFIHASADADQVRRVGELFYHDRPDAIVLALDEESLVDAGYLVRFESAAPHAERFPHIYGGPLDVALLEPIIDPAAAPKVVRSDTEEAAELQDAGWVVTAESWGARLHLEENADLALYHNAIAALPEGVTIARLGVADAAALRHFDTAVAPDFPDYVASHHEELPPDLARLLGVEALLGHGAFINGELIGCTVAKPAEGRWEIDRTAVARRYRNRGVAAALKATSLLELHRRGVRTFGTGGAGVNAASLAMNKALGYELEPLWWTLMPPVTWRAMTGPRGEQP